MQETVVMRKTSTFQTDMASSEEEEGSGSLVSD